MPHVRQKKTSVPSALDVDLQPGWLADHLECLSVSLGFRLPCVLPEAGAGTHTLSVLIHMLEIFKPLIVKGLGIWIGAGADEWMVEFGVILAVGCANPYAFFIQET